MKARPTWVRRVFISLGIGAGLGLAVAIYLYSRLTADIDDGSFREPNALDAREANRKLGLYRKALEGAERSGFIRLSEIEINSYLRQRYFTDSQQSATNAPDADPRLLESRMKVSGRGIVWYCWIKKKVFGLSIPVVWRRGLELNSGTNRWSFESQSMMIGKLEVPPRYWPWANEKLEAVDRVFAEEQRWVERLPMIEIRTNNADSSLELRLYTHRTAVTPTTRKP